MRNAIGGALSLRFRSIKLVVSTSAVELLKIDTMNIFLSFQPAYFIDTMNKFILNY